MTHPAHRLSVAPMMAWTDRHCRVFLRGITRHALLYTEMIPVNAVLRGDRARWLGFDALEHPLALQLGGSDPAALAECARIAADLGYAEINLNVGCPSPKVQSGSFGACLMAEPELVARSVAAMKAAVSVPVTVKHRIGLDDAEEWPALTGFVRIVAEAGCDRFIVHARKAWLKGLSAQQNRSVPPLRHELVHRLKAEYPALEIVINGGLRTLDAALPHLGGLDGVMLGRAAYETPYVLAEVDRRVFGDVRPCPSRAEIVAAFVPYVARSLAEGGRRIAVTRHMQGLFTGRPGAAKAWRQTLNAFAQTPGMKPDALTDAAMRLDAPAALAA
ncbi:MAG: tRNA dihydrouridine(20/20a) synthase DusA [Alphaproteobacteria bacterium]|nr:tRNA dihydrouridine(20/20a) synthase DusA [Alphaproteobacteria bacterium]